MPVHYVKLDYYVIFVSALYKFTKIKKFSWTLPYLIPSPQSVEHGSHPVQGVTSQLTKQHGPLHSEVCESSGHSDPLHESHVTIVLDRFRIPFPQMPLCSLHDNHPVQALTYRIAYVWIFENAQYPWIVSVYFVNDMETTYKWYLNWFKFIQILFKCLVYLNLFKFYFY